MQLLSNYDIIIYNYYKTLKYEYNLQTVFRILLQTSSVGRYDFFIYKYTFFFPPNENYSINVSILSIHIRVVDLAQIVPRSSTKMMMIVIFVFFAKDYILVDG